ncbi:MAG: FtsX-like permease family protein [Treponema sp.]|jgi:putative ABC transport system permease protein|nr:FtsX-like permease family protein [Treponema sp.]
MFVILTLGAMFITISSMGAFSLVGAGEDPTSMFWGYQQGICIFLSLMCVVAATGLSVALRRRDLALMRLNGASSSQLRRLIVGEAFFLAVVSGALGIWLGYLATPAVIEYINQITQGSLQATFSPDLIAQQTIFLLLIVSILGALFASRSAVRVDPAESLREVSLDKNVMPLLRILVGSVCGVGGIAIMIGPLSGQGGGNVMSSILYGTMLFTVGLVAWAPLILPALGRIIFAPIMWFSQGATPRIALASITTGRRRTASLATPILAAISILGVLAVGFTGANFGNRFIIALGAPMLVFALITIVSAQAMTYTTRGPELRSMRLLGISRSELLAISTGE